MLRLANLLASVALTAPAGCRSGSNDSVDDTGPDGDADSDNGTDADADADAEVAA